MYKWAFDYASAHVHTNLYTCMHTYLPVSSHLPVSKHAYIHACTHIYINMHAHTHIHMYTNIPSGAVTFACVKATQNFVSIRCYI